MPSAIAQLYKQAMKLPHKARRQLASRLLDSLGPDQADILDRVWADELERRFQELKSGRVKGLSREEFRRAVLDDSDESG